MSYVTFCLPTGRGPAHSSAYGISNGKGVSHGDSIYGYSRAYPDP